ncbi:MAG: Holliday junction resolvase RuvX [Bifidobacteriaceae bacterium]|nr:Holliday junction resolvase RuvX [Bifidobacteriaceae bacterium]
MTAGGAGRAGVWLGVDLGQSRVGLAVSDPDRIMATPLGTLRRDGRPVEALARQLADQAASARAGRVVVGWPLNMDGTEGAAAVEARALAAALSALGLEVGLQDERRTTVQAHAQLRAAGRKHRHHRAVVDQAAAVLILQAALDAARSGAWATPPAPPPSNGLD